MFIHFGLLITCNVFGNIKLIDINKIDNGSKYTAHYSFIKGNVEYYDHFTPEWNYSKSKEELVKKLVEAYKAFSALKPNTETLLLLGDIAHYLHNLDQKDYFDFAVKNYSRAIENDPKEYRAYWFLAFHYAQSNVPDRAIEYFLKAQELLPSDQPSDFWDDYAWSTAVANMPSHSIFAMDKAKNILGKQGNIESQLGQNIRNMIVNLNNDSTFKAKDIWSAIKGDKITIISRPLGIKILVDSTWVLSIHDYTNHQCFFTIEPSSIKNKKGKDINYTIAILMRVVNDEDKLDDFLNPFISKYSNRRKIQFSDKFDKTIAYEIRDDSIYHDIGGGHLFMMGVERKMPEYPGLLLENPFSLPKNDSGKITYYTVSDNKNRFKGRIFYMIMLDTCEDIYDQSSTVFKSFFNNQLVIE